jgi:hypothetical protein
MKHNARNRKSHSEVKMRNQLRINLNKITESEEKGHGDT